MSPQPTNWGINHDRGRIMLSEHDLLPNNGEGEGKSSVNVFWKIQNHSANLWQQNEVPRISGKIGKIITYVGYLPVQHR